MFKTATLDLWLEKKVLNDEYPSFKDFPSQDMAESTEYTGEDVEMSCQEESESAVEDVDMLNQDRLECAEMEMDIPSQDMAENYDDMLYHECGDSLLESEGKLCTKMYEQFKEKSPEKPPKIRKSRPEKTTKTEPYSYQCEVELVCDEQCRGESTKDDLLERSVRKE